MVVWILVNHFNRLNCPSFLSSVSSSLLRMPHVYSACFFFSFVSVLNHFTSSPFVFFFPSCELLKREKVVPAPVYLPHGPTSKQRTQGLYFWNKSELHSWIWSCVFWHSHRLLWGHWLERGLFHCWSKHLKTCPGREGWGGRVLLAETPRSTLNLGHQT